MNFFRQRMIGNIYAEVAKMNGIETFEFDEAVITLKHKGRTVNKSCFREVGYNLVRMGHSVAFNIQLTVSDHNSHPCDYMETK